MNSLPRISRSLAALALLLGTSACSGVALEGDQNAADDVGNDDQNGDDSQDDADESTSESDGDSSEGDSDTGTEGDGDDTGPSEGPDDPGLASPACDPVQDQAIQYDLSEAHAEIAPELV